MSQLIWQGLVPAVFLLFSLSASAAQPDWALQKSAQGVKVYTARSEKSDHLAYRAETLIPGRSVDDVLTVMRDVPGLVNWLHTCYDPALVAQEGDDINIVYMKNESPSFLVSERDLVIRQTFKRLSPETATVELTGLPDRVPPQKGFVRIPLFEGGWLIEQQGSDVKVVYSAVMDPGGAVPASVSNMMVVKMPFETVRKLSRLVQQKPRQG